MQKRGFSTREYSAPTHDQPVPLQCTTELIATNDTMQKSEPWDRYTKSTISQKIMFFTLNVHGPTKVRFLTPFFDGARPTTTTCRNCNNPISKHYVGCDHPSIMQAKV